MKTRFIHTVLLSIYMATIGCTQAHAASHQHTDEVVTDAGHIDFPVVSHIKYQGIYNQIKHINTTDRVIDLDNGSSWRISNPEIVKAWGKSKNLVITQNHLGFSTSRFALVNLDLKQAEPISLVKEPGPGEHIRFVKEVDRVNDIITLSDGKRWIAHNSDRGKLSKFSQNDRVIVGINTGVDKDKSPYLLIDTANNHFVRTHIVE